MTVFERVLREVKAHYIDYILLVIIIGLSAYVRLAPVVTGDFPFLFDHGRDMLEVKRIVIDHKLTLLGPFTGLSGLYQSPLHFYLLAVPFVLTGGNPAGELYFLAGLFLVGIGVSYAIGRTLFNPAAGVITALFFALTPTSVSNTTIFWNPYWIPVLMLPFIYFFYRGLFDSNKYLPWAGLCAGLIAQCEFAFGCVLVPVFFLLFLFYVPKFFKNKYVWFTVFAFFITFLPQVAFDLRHDFLMSKSIVHFFSGRNTSLGDALPLSTRVQYRLNELNGVTVSALSQFDLFRLLFLFLMCISAFVLMRSKDSRIKHTLVFFLSFIVVYYVFFVVFPRPAWSYYWIGLPVVYYFLAGFLLSYIFNLNRSGTLIVSTLLFFWTIATYANFFGHPEVSRDKAGTFSNMLRVVDAVYDDSKGKPFGAFVYTPPIYSYAYDYLFWWRGRTKYNRTPTASKDGLFYLVIEPNDDKPWESDGWKKTKIISGKTIWTKEFQGKITVERREGIPL